MQPKSIQVSQVRELFLHGQIFNVLANAADRTNNVCEGIHYNAIWHRHLKYLKYSFIAGFQKTIMQLIATMDLATFTEAHNEAIRLQELTKARNNNGSSTHALEQCNKSVNQIKGRGIQNQYRGNYGCQGGRGLGAPQGTPSGKGGYNNGGGNGNGSQQKPYGSRDNQYQTLINLSVHTTPSLDTIKKTAMKNLRKQTLQWPQWNHFLARTRTITN